MCSRVFVPSETGTRGKSLCELISCAPSFQVAVVQEKCAFEPTPPGTFRLLQRLYISTARQLKRIDSVRRSPIYIHFDESVVGTSSIRAYRRQEQFIAKMDKYIDNSQKPWYLIMVAQR